MMKIVAGLGSIDEYPDYVKAGADEVFCGYVPESWMLKYGTEAPLNRREVVYYNVQIGSESEMQILSEMQKDYGAPITITLNALSYDPVQYPDILKIIEKCMRLGFCSFIIADVGLLIYLKKKNIKGLKIHLSGETAENNHYMIEEMRSLGAERIIFHRKTSLQNMKQCMEEQRKIIDGIQEYESFALNEMCHFTGAFCNSIHCDEFSHMCRVPYQLGDLDQKMIMKLKIAPKKEKMFQEGYLTGESGCGLCALWSMYQAGVTHLKLVSRGNYIDHTIRDIKAIKLALDILQDSESENDYIEQMKTAVFEGTCSGNCYYR